MPQQEVAFLEREIDAGSNHPKIVMRPTNHVPVEIIPAHDLPLAEQAEIFTRALSGYVGGAFAMDANALARSIFHQGVDLCYSRFLTTTEGLVGFGYINRTENLSRLAGVGVVPEARRNGVARRLMS